MKVLILYKPISELASSVEAYAREFERETGRKLDLMDVESRDGVAKAELYDIVQQPTIIALREDGSLVNVWPERDKWPTINELSAYTL